MTVRYESWLTRDDGTRLALLSDVGVFSWSRILGQVARATFTMPASFPKSFIVDGNKVEVWRSLRDGPFKLQHSYLIDNPQVPSDAQGNLSRIISCADGNDLLKRRIVDYVNGSSEATKTDFIDDMMKAIVRENLGGSAGAGLGRDLTTSGLFSIEPDTSEGPAAVSYSFPWRRVLDVLIDLNNVSRQLETPVYFSVESATPTSYVFRTFIDQLGSDRRQQTGANPIVFSINRGNLSNVVLNEDFSTERNYIRAGGQGTGSARATETAEDEGRLLGNIWARREQFISAVNESTSAGIQSAANWQLAASRARLKLNAELRDTEAAEYNKDWNFGDRVTVEYDGRQFDALVIAVTASIDGAGKETLTGRVEVFDVA